MIGVRNPSSTNDEESGIQYLESGIHSVESRIQDLIYLTWESERSGKNDDNDSAIFLWPLNENAQIK